MHYDVLYHQLFNMGGMFQLNQDKSAQDSGQKKIQPDSHCNNLVTASLISRSLVHEQSTGAFNDTP